MIHPNTELRFISHEVGYGVVATKIIPKGTVTWVLDKLDRIFPPQEVAAMDPLRAPIPEHYTFRDQHGNCILCWDSARYVNHSFHPTCIITAYDFELAVRDIKPGDELTDDYGFLNVAQPFRCRPEKRSARKVVMPDDLLHYHRKWDRRLESAFRQFARVEQPLAAFLTPEALATAQAVAGGTRAILNCYYTGTPPATDPGE